MILAYSDPLKLHSGVHRSLFSVPERYQKTLEPPYASRPATGFLLVSLSKVPRHPLRRVSATFLAEALPINANDKAGPLTPAMLPRDCPTTLLSVLVKRTSRPGNNRVTKLPTR